MLRSFFFDVLVWLWAMSTHELVFSKRRIRINKEMRLFAEEKKFNGRFSESTKRKPHTPNIFTTSNKIRVDFVWTLTAYRIHKPFSNKKRRRKKKYGMYGNTMNWARNERKGNEGNVKTNINKPSWKCLMAEFNDDTTVMMMMARWCGSRFQRVLYYQMMDSVISYSAKAMCCYCFI